MATARGVNTRGGRIVYGIEAPSISPSWATFARR